MGSSGCADLSDQLELVLVEKYMPSLCQPIAPLVVRFTGIFPFTWEMLIGSF